MTPKRALVYDPYLPTLGGGERYALAFAEVLAEKAEVTIGGRILPSPEVLQNAGISIPYKVQVMTDQQFTVASKKFDIVLVIANHLPPRSRSAYSLLVSQFPFPKSFLRYPLRALRRSSVLREYHTVVYSEFVRSWCMRRWGIDTTVVAPPVVLGEFKRERKAPLIIAVGRFFKGWHSKRHDAMIQAFSRLPQQIRSEWRLVLAGGSTEDLATRKYIDRLRELAKGYQIDFEVNVSNERLAHLYSQSSLFWHAAGFGRSKFQPERAEHFGISTVEAMSYGTVPLVFGDGGQLEIVNESCGHCWRNIDELVILTTELIADDRRLLTLSENAYEESIQYSPKHFRETASHYLRSTTAPGWR